MKYYSKLVSIVLIFLIIFSGNIVNTSAASSTKVFVSVNGKKISSEKRGLKYKAGYLVDAKLISSKLGLKYSLISKSKTFSISKGSKKLIFTINKIYAQNGSKKVESKIAPKIISSKAFVDPTVVASFFGFKYVKYNSKNNTLEINLKAPITPTPTINPTTTIKPTVAPTLNPTPTIVVTSTPTQSPTPSPTASPTLTPTPTIAPTPSPTPFNPNILPTPMKNSLIRLFIDTENGEELLNPTDKDKKIKATIVIDDGKSSPTTSLSATDIILSGRGNSTFEEIPLQYPKRPLKFEFADDKIFSVCGMPAAEKWNLLANLYDKSLIRNALALNLGANMSGLQYTTKTKLVEVFMNRRYHGVFLLTEAVEVDPNRLNLDTTGDNPGFLVEWDQRAKEEGEAKYAALEDKVGKAATDYYFNIPDLCKSSNPNDRWFANGVCFAYKDLKGDKMIQVQRDFVKKTVTDLSKLLINPADGQYLNKINLNSFVDYYMLNDFFQNGDAVNFSSINMFQDKGGKMNMGPVWDFDLYIGNNGGAPANKCLEWGNPWFGPLFTKSTAFRQAFNARWKIVKPIIQTSVINYIDILESELGEAQKRNFECWDVMNFKFDNLKNRTPSGSFSAEISYLKSWLNQRVAYADGYYK